MTLYETMVAGLLLLVYAAMAWDWWWDRLEVLRAECLDLSRRNEQAEAGRRIAAAIRESLVRWGHAQPSTEEASRRLREALQAGAAERQAWLDAMRGRHRPR